ncbi:genetic competence negative regulator [Bacillota bacterium Lsc_1132]
MRLERLTSNKIKIFLTSDDLYDRGLSKEDIWSDSNKWQQLFHEMLKEASEEFDVDFHGSVAVEIFSLQAQGMIMIITVDDFSEDEEMLYDSFIEMQVLGEGIESLLYEFANIEDVIELANRLLQMNISGGNLYVLGNRYFLFMNDLHPSELERTASILSEYGDASIMSPYVLFEYGKKIIENNTIETIHHYFS